MIFVDYMNRAKRGDFGRLRADHHRLEIDVRRVERLVIDLRGRIDEHSGDLRTQFTRIAQIQAILDRHHLTLTTSRRARKK